MRQTVAFLPTIREITTAYPHAMWVELAGRTTLAAGIRETLADDQAAPAAVASALARLVARIAGSTPHDIDVHTPLGSWGSPPSPSWSFEHSSAFGFTTTTCPPSC